jgi:hypothetical protein
MKRRPDFRAVCHPVEVVSAPLATAQSRRKNSRKFLWRNEPTLLHSRTLLRADLLDSLENSESTPGKTSLRCD